jgi:hypothetical protein
VLTATRVAGSQNWQNDLGNRDRSVGQANCDNVALCCGKQKGHVGLDNGRESEGVTLYVESLNAPPERWDDEQHRRKVREPSGYQPLRSEVEPNYQKQWEAVGTSDLDTVGGSLKGSTH